MESKVPCMGKVCLGLDMGGSELKLKMKLEETAVEGLTGRQGSDPSAWKSQCWEEGRPEGNPGAGAKRT